MRRKSCDVLVVGAGLAGLAAAWRLTRDGLRVTLMERARFPGGRAAVVHDRGYAFEATPPLLTRADRRLVEWIDEVGLRDEMLPLRPLTTAILYRGELCPADVRRLIDVRRIPGVRLLHALRLVRFPRLLARYGDAIDIEAPERAAALDDRSLADFCRLYFGASALDQWMEPRATRVASGDAEEMSRVQFLHQYRAHALERPGMLRVGFDELAARVSAALPVRFESEVNAIEQTPDGVRALLSSGDSETARAAIMATSARDAVRITGPSLSSAEREHLQSVHYTPMTTVVAALRRPLAPRPSQILIPRSERLPIDSVLLEPGLPGGRVPEGRGLATLRTTNEFAVRAAAVSPSALEKELLGTLETIWPGARGAVEFSHTFRSEHAFPRFDVGRYRAIARFERVRADRRHAGSRIYFAGDYLVHPSQEGAMISARRAAAAVTEDLGSDPRPGAPSAYFFDGR